MRYLFLLLALASCTTVSQSERWSLPTGEKVICLKYEQQTCGLSLLKCGHDHSVDFECLSEAQYYGPGDAFEPEIYDEKGTKK